MDDVARAMRQVMPTSRVGRIQKEGCTELYSNAKHWVCLFPQHGRGRKHERRIVLEPWQTEIAIERHPRQLVRGMIESDGCRCINRVTVKGQRYEYVRYLFTNVSDDLHGIFELACAQIGVQTRRCSKGRATSIARRDSVEILESFIGPKR